MKKIALLILLLIALAVAYFLFAGYTVENDTSANDYGAGLESSQPGRTLADYKEGPVAVSDEPFSRTLRSVSLEDVHDAGKKNGIWDGAPKVKENWQAYQDAFYATLASKKVWNEGTSPAEHKMHGDITWANVPIPQDPPPPCYQPQKTGYDAEGCRIVNSLFKDLEKTDPAKAAEKREEIRRGRDVWFKFSFGSQDLNEIHLKRAVGEGNMHYTPWMHTSQRPHRFTKWGLINDPDCVQGDESTFWLDKCKDPFSTGILGYRKYPKDPIVDDSGKVVFDPKTSPYEEGELETNKRWAIGHPCVQCHVAFDPTNPPANPNEPEWANLTGHIGNQYTVQPMTFLMGTPNNHFTRTVIKGGRPGTIDTSANPNDFIHNPGTQNNITDFMNKRTFMHEMKHPVTGEVKEAPTFHVLKGGEDSVGDWLALIRVYVNIGLCTEECWSPKFPLPGALFGDDAKQQPFDIQQCSNDCEVWNWADAKMPTLASYLFTGGPYPLMQATDVDGTKGESLIDLSQVPRGHKVFARECASCHSTKVPPDSIAGDKDALESFYSTHAFGSEDYWQYEFAEADRNSPKFQNTALTTDANGNKRLKQFADKGEFGQDWLGNDELTPYGVVGTNRCRAMHTNHNEGHIWDQFASETFKNRPAAGSEERVLNPIFPGIGGLEVGTKEIGPGGPGYYRNISLLSVWAHAPFLHNNAVGELTYLDDGTIDYTVKGRVEQFEMAMKQLLMSDDENVTPHRTPKITKTDRDIRLAIREDGQGLPKLKVPAGTPVANIASQNPHNALFMTCSDLVENKGHQFGVDLSADDKSALTEFLKLM